MQSLVEAATSHVEQATAIEPLPNVADFVRWLAHELRQPLSAIESIAYYLDLVLPPNAANAREQLAKLQDLVEQSDWMVANAVDFVQATTVSQERVNLAEIVPSAAAGALREAPPVRVDRTQVERLVRNLLVFFEHAGAEGSIAFDASVDCSGLVVIQASAPAAGSPEYIEAFFQPFHPGLPPGLGLAVASMVRVAENHGGWVRTSAEDKQVTVQIALPPA